jgi:GTP cyclohydrolase II
MGTRQEHINGHPVVLMIERAVEEMRRGRAIQLVEGDRCWLVAAVETMESALLDRLTSLNAAELRLLITPQRAKAAALAGMLAGPIAISFPRGIDLEELRSLAGVGPRVHVEKAALRVEPVQSPASVAAGFRLAKLGRLLPAVISLGTESVPDSGLVRIRVEDIDRYARSAHDNLTLISRARVPLVETSDSEIVLFRQHGFGEHLAIVIGEPDVGTAVPVRLHSACLTGDLLGSLRCDCGDQLRRAISRVTSLGGGVLLYLDQEGRGIGLANKLRAYALQDAGLDTLDADQHLGFLPDERTYDVAAAMLRTLGIKRIRLLTNNPSKIDALTEHGIEVVGRIPLVAPITPHNQRYLRAKVDRAGHLAE